MRIETLLKYRKNKFLKRIIHKLLLRKGVDIPASVIIGNNVQFPHNSFGTVIHPNTVIGNNVKIYQNVTIGRSDINLDFKNSKMKDSKIIIEDGAIICAGAKVLSKEKNMRIGKNSIVGANAVLLNSIGDNEVWAGVPARKIKTQNR